MAAGIIQIPHFSANPYLLLFVAPFRVKEGKKFLILEPNVKSLHYNSGSVAQDRGLGSLESGYSKCQAKSRHNENHFGKLLPIRTAAVAPCSCPSPHLLLVAEERSCHQSIPANPPAAAGEGRDLPSLPGPAAERLLKRQVLWFPKSRLKRLQGMFSKRDFSHVTH